MKIAYLILCHTDPTHIGRLSNKLTHDNDADVYIHVDIDANIEDFKMKVGKNNNVKFLETRIKPYWGGFSAVEATLLLIKEASKNKYDRYILLQGLDYPIVSNRKIREFFARNKEIEFIRGCNTTISNEKKLYSKSKMYWFFDKKNFWKKILNKLNSIIGLKTRPGYIYIDGKRHDIYWGAAQWALTHECIEYILEFYDRNTEFNQYFKYVFPADETYFHSIIFNSEFLNKTTYKGAEKDIVELCDIRNLHYFEYPDLIKIFDISDYDLIKNQECLFIRKTTTKKSTELLDLIDKETV